jgi:3-hydroxyisobutyrate dehydrogenase
MALRAGFVGLGNIGKPMAERLVAQGVETAVFDLAAAPVAELAAQGAKAASSLRELAAGAAVIGICVPADEHVRAVLAGEDGVLAAAAPGSVVAIHSTILPATAQAMGALAAERGVGLLDACVTGGAARALQGKLTVLAGGDAGALERARPYLEVLAERILHAGPLGDGCKLKLCINLLTYLQWLAAFEASLLAKAVGLPQEVLEEAGRSNGQLSELMIQYLALHKAPEAARRSEPMQKLLRGHMDVAEKDLAWALRLAHEAGVALPGAALASQLMARIYAVEDPQRR